MFHAWMAMILVLLMFVTFSHAQTPCQKANCPNTTYCAEKSDSSTECIGCDTSCVGCYGPGPNYCRQCQIGYLQVPNQPCSPCPTGFYGLNCSSICHCLDNELCNKTNGSCMGWKCDRGYTGLPFCQELCPQGTFNLDCQSQCHCPDNDNCSNVNGDCSSGQCHPDWTGAGCQRRLPKLTNPPELVESKCGNITLQWEAFQETKDIGSGPVYQYNLYMMLNYSSGAPDWTFVGGIPANPTLSKYTYSVTSGLVPNEEYNFRVDVIGSSFGKPLSQSSAGIKSEVIMNPCLSTTTRTTESTTKIAVSKKVLDQITSAPLSSTSINLTWTILPEFQAYTYNVNLTLQLLGQGDCDNNGGPPLVIQPNQFNSNFFVFDNLSDWSTYRITISIVAVNANLSETLTQVVTTVASLPVGSITAFQIVRITSSEAFISWGPVPCSLRKGPLKYYTVRLASVSSSSMDVNTAETTLKLDNLTVYTNYSVQISYTNPAGQGPWSDMYNFTTLEGVPSPVEILDLIPTYSTIIVAFSRPITANGHILSFTATLSANSSDFRVSQSTVFDATNIVTSLVIPRLSPETLYFLKMAASTSAGIGQYGSVKQASTMKAPSPLGSMTLQLVSQTTNCLTVNWTLPTNAEITLSKLVLAVKKVTADDNVQMITTEIPLLSDSYQVCQLKPSTLYSVTITGTNMDGAVTSATDNFVTAHGTPPTPIAPVFVRSTYTSITISIEPVVSLDVPITNYEIQVEFISKNRRRRFAGVPGYLAANLSSDVVTKRREFVVGDGQSYGGYINKALERDSYYMIYYVAISTLNRDTTGTWSQLKAAVRTVPFDPALAPPLAIQVASKSTNCLNITWVLQEDGVSVTTGFTITLEATSNTSSPITEKEVGAETRSHQECNLSPYTPYTVEIVAQAASGVLTIASDTFFTAPNAPRRPTAPIFVSASFSTIIIAIEPIILTDAPVTAYQLRVQTVSLNMLKRAVDVPGYIAAQLTQGDVTKKMNFIIGDGKNYGGFTNLPLTTNTLYTVHYVVISSADNDTKFSYSSLNPPARTVPATNPEDDKGVLIGVIAGLVIFVIIIIILLLLYCWWRRNKNRFNPYQVQENDKSIASFSEVKEDNDVEKYWSSVHSLKDSRYIIAGTYLVYGENQLSHLRQDSSPHPHLPKISFSDEFNNLPKRMRRATDNISQQNRNLNKHQHLLPYDHSLIKLKPDTSSRRTYINASYVLGYKKGPTYIAAQSPFDNKTTVDFWRLIYQKSIKTVVMVTNVIEDGFVKCTRYWPENSKENVGNFLLHLIDVKEYADFVVRTVGVKSKGDEHSKIVKIFQFKSWPVHGIPEDPIPFLEMRFKVRRYHHDGPGPILVHCATGMGRTGVFIAVDALIDQYASERRATVFDFVRRMRKDRPHMVRTQNQYNFIYETMFEEFHAGNTLVDFDLKDQYHNWIQKNPHTNQTFLKDQQLLLNIFSKKPSKDEFKTGLLDVNITKNRYKDILPPDHHRPLLKSQGGLYSTDYINAVFLDSYFKKNHFLITQTPLHTTIIDFWKMVYDYEVCTIVMVEDFTNEDNSCAEYWPSMNLKHFEPFFIETIATFQLDSLTIRNFNIRSTQHPKKPARIVRQFQFDAWAHLNLTPPSRTTFLDLIDGIFAWQDEICKDEKPIIVHCQNGASHSGLFAVMAILCERMEEEEEVDVYRTIKHCKQRREQIVAEYEQLRFCYKALWDFINLRMSNGLFTDSTSQNKVVNKRSLNISSQSSEEDMTEI